MNLSAMKRYIIMLFFLAFLASSCDTSSKRVYICTGPYSRAYHKTDNCIGLSRCSGDIEGITEVEAKDEGRHRCHFCYD